MDPSRVVLTDHAKASIECRMERFIAGVRVGVVAAVSETHPDVIVVTAMPLGANS